MNNFLPNTTQVPNIIFDKIMAHLTGSEFKVLLFFVRQRYGFQKFTGQFGYAIKQICEGIKRSDGTTICEGTGLSNRQVLNSLKTLKEKYHLIKMKHGDFKGKICNKYELTIGEITSSVDKNLGEKSSLNTGEKSSSRVGEESSLKSVKKVHYQETNIKPSKKSIETNIGYPTSLNTKLFIDKYSDWIKYRKEIKKKLSQMTVAAQLKKLEKHGIEAAIWAIDNSIEKGYQGLFPENFKSNEPTKKMIKRTVKDENGKVKIVEVESVA